MRNILITGGAGFIGINAANYFLNKNDKIVIFDNFSRKGSRENVHWLQKNNEHTVKVIEADILKNKKILYSEISKADVVLHLASQVAVTTSVLKPMYDFKVNALGTMNVLEGVRKSLNKPILLFSSTNKVYGDLANAAITEKVTRFELKDFPNGISEDYPVNFKSPYGCSKGAGDQYVHDYHTIYGLKTIVFRQSCIYGPHQFGIVDQGWIAWFIIALLTGKDINIYGTGKQVRDLLYVDDLIRAYDLAVKNIDKTSGQIYNLGGGRENTISVWTELKPKLEKLFNKEITVKIKNERPGDQKIFFANIAKAKTDFNWEPKINIDKGITSLYNWAKENKLLLQKYF